tara:strand:+ start:1744 stop:2361 length:618 start_codon:yes stop_codon:yes gene_type:complete
MNLPSENNLAQETFDRDGYVIVDDFLFTDVVNELHQLAIDHEQVDDLYRDYHSINFDNKKFPFEILPDVINAIHVTFPMLHPLEFDRGWAFVCNNEGNGVTPHADPASVNVNLWVTGNESVDDPTKNGLIIYDKQRPSDWSYDQYNSDVAGIKNYLQETNAKQRLIPYQFNRMILFDSRYFHKTNGVSMKEGKENRRVNYTFMFK